MSYYKKRGTDMFWHNSFRMGAFFYQFFETLVYVAPAILISISLHEFAHGYVSCKLGDMTPKMDGRLTLNPFRHLDVWGTLCLLIFHVGWARPIRVNTRNYKNPKRDMILVAAAGPIMNFLLAFAFLFLHGILFDMDRGFLTEYLYVFSYYAAVLNVGLGIFNLIPIPPLDGANILSELCPKVNRFYFQIRRYGIFVMALLLGTGVLSIPLAMMNQSVVNGMWKVVVRILRLGVFTFTGGNRMVI